MKLKSSKVILTKSEYEKKILEYNIEKNHFESKIDKYNQLYSVKY